MRHTIETPNRALIFEHQIRIVNNPPPPPHPSPTISPDGTQVLVNGAWRKLSPDRLSYWDGNAWMPVSGPVGARVPPPKDHPARTVSVTTLAIIVLATVVAFTSGFVSIEHHDNLGGWTVGVAGYSCWLSPQGDSTKSYCGPDSGFFHIPNPPTHSNFGAVPAPGASSGSGQGSPATGVIGDTLPDPPADPGTTYSCVTVPEPQMYRMNACDSHAATIDGHFTPFVHAGQTVCYQVLLAGPQSFGYQTQNFTCEWRGVPEGA